MEPLQEAQRRQMGYNRRIEEKILGGNAEHKSVSFGYGTRPGH